MSKSKKRFRNEGHILGEIDSILKQVPNLKKRALELKKEAESLVDANNFEYAREVHKESDRLFKKARNIEDGKGRIGTLKAKLAEFRTEVMPFMGGDNSVPMR